MWKPVAWKRRVLSACFASIAGTACVGADARQTKTMWSPEPDAVGARCARWKFSAPLDASETHGTASRAEDRRPFAGPGSSSELLHPGSLDTVAADCKSDHCGLNGMWFGQGLSFREIHLDGGYNKNVLRLRLPTPDRPTSYAIIPSPGRLGTGQRLADFVLEVEAAKLDQLRIRNKTDGTVVTGSDLEGTQIILESGSEKVEVRTKSGEVELQPLTFFIKIDEVSRTDFWDCPGPPCGEQAFRYRFSATTNADGGCEVEMCRPELADEMNVGASIQGTAVVFKGDVYDDDTFNIRADAAGAVCGEQSLQSEQMDIVNFACMGTTVSKLHLLRHTWASTSPGKETRVSQRQAVLRMLTADFCGDGTSFTENGTRIQFDAYRWGPFLGYAAATNKGSPPTTRRPLQELTPPGDAGPGMPLAPGWAPTLLEAIWNDRGAICLEPTTRIPIPTPVVCGSPPSKQWTIPRCTSNDRLAASAPSSTGCPDLSGNYLISATAHPL